MDQVAAQQQATCSMLEFLLSTATRRQHLRLSCRNLQELPAADNLAQLSSLRSLTISKCSSLQELPASIGRLSQLTSLVLYACDELASNLQKLSLLYNHRMKFGSLPSQLKRLPKLRSLRISAANLNLARLFIGMAAMRGLRSVTINMAGRDKKTAEQGLPDDIMMPLATHTGLTSLTLDDWRIRQLPASIGQLASLRSLKITDSSIRSLPESIAGLTGLTALSLNGCRVQTLPSSVGQLGQLQSMYIDHCDLQELPASLAQLTGIQDITVSHCDYLRTVPGELQALQDAEVTDGFKRNPRFGGDCTLSHLDPDPSPSEIAAKQRTTSSALGFLLSTATHLQQLRLSCENLEELPAADSLGQLSDLRSLEISECRSLQELPASIGSLSRLTSLTICECDELKELPESLGDLAALQELSISNCMMLQELPASLAGLAALQTLELDGNTYLGALDEEVLAGMTSLRQLSISMCTTMRTLPRSLLQASNLQELSLLYNRDLKLGWLPGQLKRLPKLHTLKIEARKLDAAALFKGMGAMKGLRSALLEGFQRNKKSKEQELPDDLMAPPAGHTGLTSLHLSSWHGKQLPASIGQLASLRSLKITGSSIVTLPDSISGLTALAELRMEHCDVRSLPGNLGQLLQLKMLYIDHCEDLLELPASLGALTGIQHMNVSCCRSLRVVPDELRALRR
ncbi:hypothetical protein OEZ85_007246 [Tetradesmus obliquus]|uniref:Disease resistance R13L4/SHOC-2-like LRR domain-containing protein n=1 Tax=Tetradesmus obliquus TaxID=3088 RepID=A0ABY8TZL6_TETOB|nr:hypothetical protein OEZ85_007246 [Tetradesmus obliquus]